jgi:uncharacterized C2H2 Zn-finger protein
MKTKGQLKYLQLNGFKEVKDFRNPEIELKGVECVYVFLHKKEICRLMGKSAIIKIGQTKNLHGRLKRYFSKEDASKLKNKPKRQTAYRLRTFVDSKVGIKLMYKICKSDGSKQHEKSMMKEFQEQHMDLPPLNMCSR